MANPPPGTHYEGLPSGMDTVECSVYKFDPAIGPRLLYTINLPFLFADDLARVQTAFSSRIWTVRYTGSIAAYKYMNGTRLVSNTLLVLSLTS